MASKENHIQQYNKNKSLANSKHLRQSQFKDWRVVVIFYATMHYLESSYADVTHTKTHTNRKKLLNSVRKYEPIIDDYENLEMLSRKARYDCVDILDSEVTDALVNLKSVEDFINKEIN